MLRENAQERKEESPPPPPPPPPPSNVPAVVVKKENVVTSAADAAAAAAEEQKQEPPPPPAGGPIKNKRQRPAPRFEPYPKKRPPKLEPPEPRRRPHGDDDDNNHDDQEDLIVQKRRRAPKRPHHADGDVDDVPVKKKRKILRAPKRRHAGEDFDAPAKKKRKILRAPKRRHTGEDAAEEPAKKKRKILRAPKRRRAGDDDDDAEEPAKKRRRRTLRGSGPVPPPGSRIYCRKIVFTHMSKKALKRAITVAYTDEKLPCAFTSVANVHRHVQKTFPNVKYDFVEQVLQDLESFTLHRPNRKRFPRLKTQATGVYTDLQADLVDMSKYKSSNDSITFLLTVIDIYTRCLFVKSLKSKHGALVAKALADIFKEMGTTPNILFTDDGKEFYNRDVKTLLESHNIKHVSPKNDTKCGVVERVNRTLKTRLAKYMTHAYGHRYIDVLQRVVLGINNSYHRGIGRKPVEVRLGDFPIPFPDKSSYKIKFRLGDHVRLAAKRGVFDKGYDQGWTAEVFVISATSPGKPVTYKVVDTNGEPVEGIFYTHELTKCTYKANGTYRVESIIARRTRNGIRQCLVRWEGYTAASDSWVPESSLLQI
ncbi:hypothetical protein CAEBREN_30204 [Caenorhabditis brenneri]|uniref:Integrase catalytic domain-containing protein n=1 Tax=Caenorhabditis brenneri TaxID=135651 RepID=G0NY71_CAEBE|nr:hypothetical protein CAEBREN_30204 [Caenorhabditis brenneri]